MAFSAEKTGDANFGSMAVTHGTWDGGGDNGGDINTGLRIVQFFIAVPHGAAPAAAPAIAETFPLVETDVTIACGADVDGYWMALGSY